MRVLHLDTGKEMRGGQHQALLLMTALATMGVGQKLLARRDGALLARAREAGFDAAPVSALAVCRESGRASIVHCHDARAHTLAAVAARAPVVVARRVAFAVKPGPLSKWKYRRAARYIAVSDFVRQRLVEAGVDAASISVVRDAVDLPPAPSTLDGPVVAPDLADPLKGGALLRSLPAAVRLSTDLAAALRTARAFLYLTESEGLGSAALLAMAHGVPVVASRRGGLPEIIVDGETGLLVENTIESVMNALGRIQADPGWARRLGAAGRQAAASRHSPAQMAAATLAAYRAVLA